MPVDFDVLNEILAQFGTRTGPNCAEVMFLYGQRKFDLDAPPELLRVATPFGGGMGVAEDTCGVLTGGLIVIGLKYGRRNLDGDKQFTYKVAKRYFDWFLHTFGSTNCKALNGSEYNTPAHAHRCGSFLTKSLGFLDGLFKEMDAEKA
jgi:C_GCAxxG_C_C family probable redox protein